MLHVINYKWFRGILVGAALLAPLGYIGLRNGLANAQMGTPITPGSSVNATIAPSTAPTLDLSVGSSSSVDSSASPASGLSASSADNHDTHATTTDDSADTSTVLDVSEDDTDLVEMATTVDEDPEETIAEDETENAYMTASHDEVDTGDHQIVHSLASDDEEE